MQNKIIRSIRNFLISLPMWGGLGWGVTSCSETRNLAEDETLYTGIRTLSYDTAPRHQRPQADSTGVITALGNAYNTVSDMLTGKAPDAKEQKQPDVQLTPQQRDSVRLQWRLDDDAYAEAREEVEGALKHAPNNSLMGSSFHRTPLPIGLWIYNNNVYKENRWGRWLMNNFAATPVYMTTVNPRIRTQVAQNTLRNHGFFRASVRHDIVPQKNPRKAKVDYEVHPGPLFHLDSISFLRFPTAADSLVRRSMSQTRLYRGHPFNAHSLADERLRLSTLFRNHGFYFYQPSYIAFLADTLQRPLHVQLRVLPSPETPSGALRQYHIGRTRINVYDCQAQALRDSFTFRSFTLAHSGAPRKPPIRFRSMARYITLRHGQLYSQEQQDAVQQNLAAMGVFSAVSLNYTPRDTTDTLDVSLTLRLDRPYDAEFRANVASKSNGLIGPGASFSMSKKNTFRGAETLSLEAHGSYEWQTGAQMKGQGQVINSYEYGVALNLLFPRLTMLGLGKRWNRKANATTNYKIDANWMNRSGYFGRVTMGVRVAYTYQRHQRHQREKHEFVPFRLDYNMQLHSTERFDSIVSHNQALYASMRNQFVPAMQYTFQGKSRQHARHSHLVTLVAKEAGNVTSGIYRAFGQEWNRQDKHLFGVPFAQYAKLTAEHTAKYRLGHTRTSVATRLFAGAVWSYGNSTIAPYSDLFVIGGANSIRAFGVRTIGPGRYNPGRSNYSYIDEMGDMKFEANVEYRFPLVADLHGAIFLDAGNVWLMIPDASRPGGAFRLKDFPREIALGTGFGLRYDLDFLVIRFDVGIGLHAPYDTDRSGYYNMTRFSRSLGYHIAIGYPF